MPLDLSSIAAKTGDLTGSIAAKAGDLTGSIADKAGDLTGSIADKAGDLTGQATDYIQSDGFKDILPYLLSGGAGALAGGVMTGGRKEDEGRLGYLGRILRNAGLTAGLAGGGHYLLNRGLNDVKGNVANADFDLPQEGPLTTATKNIAFSPVTAGLAGAAGLAATHKRPLLGAGDKSTPLDVLAKEVGKSPAALRVSTAEQLGKMKKLRSADNARLRQLAGLPSDHIARGSIGELLQSKLGLSPDKARKIKGGLSSLTRKGPLSTLGQTWPSRAGRGALSLAAAGLPALLGSILTKETPQ